MLGFLDCGVSSYSCAQMKAVSAKTHTLRVESVMVLAEHCDSVGFSL